MPTHTLSGVDEATRSASCSGCGSRVSIKRAKTNPSTGKVVWRCRVRYNQIRSGAPSRLDADGLQAMKERYPRALSKIPRVR